MRQVTIRTETVYSVDGQDFSDHLTALNHASWLDCLVGMTRYNTLDDMLKNSTKAAIVFLEGYISAKNHNERIVETSGSVKCLPHFPDSAFDYDKAWKAENIPGGRLYIQDSNDMMDHLARMQTENSGKIPMIKLVRSCYTPTPGLLETKNYVEDTFFR